jgi:hypothetical protein
MKNWAYRYSKSEAEKDKKAGDRVNPICNNHDATPYDPGRTISAFL